MSARQPTTVERWLESLSDRDLRLWERYFEDGAGSLTRPETDRILDPVIPLLGRGIRTKDEAAELAVQELNRRRSGNPNFLQVLAAELSGPRPRTDGGVRQRNTVSIGGFELETVELVVILAIVALVLISR